MFGYGAPSKPAMDREVRIPLGMSHLAMYRFYLEKGELEKVPFELCHREGECRGVVQYRPHQTDAQLNEWRCTGCTSPGGLLFTDKDLKTLSMVRLKQLLYVRRQWNHEAEKTQLLDYDGRVGHGHHFSRDMTKQEENDYHVRIIMRSVETYFKERP